MTESENRRAHALGTGFVVLLFVGLGLFFLLNHAAMAVPAVATSGSLTLPDGSTHTLQTPSDLRVAIYASGLSQPRFMALGPKGDIFVGSSSGAVSVLRPQSDGATARVLPLLNGLTTPHSVFYRHGLLYVGEQNQVEVMRYDGAKVTVSDRHVVVPNLPTGGRHVTRTIVTAPDGSLYVSIGSSCNVCIEPDSRRAAIMHYNADGSGGKIYASGLRNAVGLAFQPGTNTLWATSNGRDDLGDNIPPDLVTVVHRNDDFGWPYCYGDRLSDPDVPPPTGRCARITLATKPIQAHSAPLGLAFYTRSLLPTPYHGGLFVAYHGSWNRSSPTGYKLVYIPVHGTKTGPPRDIVTGWLVNGSAWGRPVGVVAASDGSLLISDDTAGLVYRLTPATQQ